MSNTDEIKTAWISRSTSKKDKPWGHERSWSSFTAGHGKILSINKGFRTSLKYNPQKNESLFVLTGKLQVTFGDELSIAQPSIHPMTIEMLSPGECLNVQSGCPYRLEAIEASEVVEIGTFLSDKPVRIEDDYGRASKKNT